MTAVNELELDIQTWYKYINLDYIVKSTLVKELIN